MKLNSPTDAKNNLNRSLSFMICSKSASQCTMNVFTYLLPMRNQCLTGKRITCQSQKEQMSTSKQISHKWEQLGFIRFGQLPSFGATSFYANRFFFFD